MANITLRDIQNVEYKILKEFNRICKKYDIEYYLAQGTLLGAVRHQGFIPWDDDIDVIIPYRDLLKLASVFKNEAPDEYMLTNYKVEKHFPLTWSKIRAKNTLSRPVRYRDIPMNWGICIDLFPVYPISGNKALRTLEIFFFKASRKMLMAEMTQYEENHNFVVRLMEKIPIGVRHFFLDMSLKILSLHNDKSEYVYLMCKDGKVFRRDWIFGDKKQLLFEDEEFPVPNEYDKYLKEMFGDYMTPPPKEEQGGHDLRMGEIEWGC